MEQQSQYREDPRLINGKVKRQIAEKSGHVRNLFVS